MKTFIVKRKKDNMYLNMSENEWKITQNRETWDGTKFNKDFEFVGEEKNNDADMEALFGEK